MQPLKTPVRYIRALPGGTAHVLLFNDGKHYVVKWNFERGHARCKEAVNEYVAGSLATLLSLPQIPFELVYIPEGFIKKTPELHTHPYRPGYQYGCLYIDNSIVFRDIMFEPPAKSQILNRSMLAGIMIFDQWVNNADRTKSNLLLERKGASGYYVHMIDHGKCFPGKYKWSEKSLRRRPAYSMDSPVYWWAFSLLDSPQELRAFANRAASLPNEAIYGIIRSIPTEWSITPGEREALYQFLVSQKRKLLVFADLYTELYGDMRL